MSDVPDPTSLDRRACGNHDAIAASILACLEVLCSDPTIGASAQEILARTMHGQIFAALLALDDEEKAARASGKTKFIVDSLSERIGSLTRGFGAHAGCRKSDCQIETLEGAASKARAAPAGTFAPFMFVAPVGAGPAVRDLIARGEFRAWDPPKFGGEEEEEE